MIYPVLETKSENGFKTIQEVEKDYILKMLSITKSKREASRLLGITVKTLYNKLHEYGIFEEKKFVIRTVEEARTGVTELPRPSDNRNGVG